MQRWRGLEDIPEGWGRSVVTIGSYDGVHRGHQLIIGRTVARARELGVPAVVVTFDPHPSEVVRPGSHPPLLAPHPRRAELMARAGRGRGAGAAVHRASSRSSRPADFVVKVLVDKLHARSVVEGPNFRFGHKAAGDVRSSPSWARPTTTRCVVVDLYERGTAGGGEPFSSSLARRLVAEGDVAGAAEVLGRPHRVEGVVVRGAQRGRELGFPTANVETVPHTAVPGRRRLRGLADRRRRARCPRRSRWAPTRSSTAPSAPSRRTPSTASDLDLYGMHVAVDFLAYIRGQEKFDTLDALLERMAEDVDRCRDLVAEADGAPRLTR